MEITAIVQKIVKGKHGPYAVALATGVEGSVTFSLGSKVWSGAFVPEPGTVVVLSNLLKKKAGWRAMSARFFGVLDA